MPKKSGASSASPRPPFELQIRGACLCLGRETKIMGVLNVTPDSFSDGGIFKEPAQAEKQALRMQDEGAHLIDIGGESSRPGGAPISVKEEIRRVRPVLKRLSRKIKIPLSIDTYKYEVAWAALDEGVSLVNDIYALNADKRLAKLIARYKAGVVLMHMRGTPETMQKNLAYSDLVAEVSVFLKRAAVKAVEAGISPRNILLDPGFGFGKSVAQNCELLARLDSFKKLGFPLLTGLSRKSFIGSLLEAPAPDRLYGSLGAAAAAVERGAHVLRVHDVLAHRQLCAALDRVINEQTERKNCDES